MSEDRSRMFGAVDRRVLLPLLMDAGLDVPIGLGLVVAVGVIDVYVFCASMVLRALVWSWQIHRSLAPVRAWRRLGDDASDAQVLSADSSLQTGPRRLLTYHSLGWLITLLVVLVLAYFSVPHALDVGASEFVIATLIIIAAAFAHPVLMAPVLRRSLTPDIRDVGRTLLERKLVAARPWTPFRTKLMANNLGIAWGVVVGVGGLAGLTHVKGVRAEALAQLRGRVQVGALQLRVGNELGDRALKIIETAQLPGVLEVGRTPDEVVGVFDASRGRVVAAARIESGYWVVGELEPDDQIMLFAAFILALGVSMAVPIGFASDAVSRELIEPLTDFERATSRMVEGGELHTLGRVVPLYNDELGGLIVNFNELMDRLEQLADAAQAVARGDLRVELEHPGDLYDAFRGMLEQLHEIVLQIRSTALDVTDAASEIHLATQTHELATEQHSTSVVALNATLSSLTRSAEHIWSSAESVLENAERGVVTSDAMVATSAELSAQTSSIADMLGLIREIADRSDLLALNGSLEAVRAGQTGRGFGLVASEMRRLAERVTGAVAQVGEQLANIESVSASTVTATQSSRSLAASTADAARLISTTTQTQSQATQQASQAVEALAEVTAATVQASTQTRAAAERLRAQVARLEQETRRFQLRHGDTTRP